MQPAAGHRSLLRISFEQAVRDVRNPNWAPIDSASARAFLSGPPMLSYWCEIAELDLNSVIDRARTLMAGCSAEAHWDAQGAENRSSSFGASLEIHC